MGDHRRDRDYIDAARLPLSSALHVIVFARVNSKAGGVGTSFYYNDVSSETGRRRAILALGKAGLGNWGRPCWRRIAPLGICTICRI